MPISIDPLLEPIQVAALVGIAVIASWWRMTHLPEGPGRGRRFAHRLIILLLLGFVLLNPVTSASQRDRAKPVTAILIDISLSMDETDGKAATASNSRLGRALAATMGNPGWKQLLEAKSQIAVIPFSASASLPFQNPGQLLSAPKGSVTDLSAAINSAQAVVQASGSGGSIVLISDGRDTTYRSPVDAARSARVSGTHVHTLVIGERTKNPDLVVRPRSSHVYASPGQRVSVTVEAWGEDIPTGQRALSLKEGSKVLETRTVKVQQAPRGVQFVVKQTKPGLYRYVVESPSIPGEVNLDNNRATIYLVVEDQRSRVLLLEGEPSWDARFLVQSLRESGGAQVDALFKVTDSKYYASLSGADSAASMRPPNRIEDFRKYDVVVLGRSADHVLTHDGLAALKQWVIERGGALVFLRGRADQSGALRDIAPLNWTESEVEAIRLSLTEEGKSFPGFASGMEDLPQNGSPLPELTAVARSTQDQGLAVVMARGHDAKVSGGAEEFGVIAYRRIGAGTTLAISGDGLWEWAFNFNDAAKGERAYSRFWQQTLRWLEGESDFLPSRGGTLRTDKPTYLMGETVRIMSENRADPGKESSIYVLGPSGRRTQIPTASSGNGEPLVGTLEPTEPGDYLVEAKGAKGSKTARCVFRVDRTNQEAVNRSANPELMKQIAEAGGGEAFSLQGASRLPEALLEGRIAAVTSTRTLSNWNTTWVLATLIGLPILDWVLRRRGGML